MLACLYASCHGIPAWVGAVFAACKLCTFGTDLPRERRSPRHAARHAAPLPWRHTSSRPPACHWPYSTGDIGDVEELPEGTEAPVNPNAFRIRPRGQDLPSNPSSRRTSRDEAAEGAAGVCGGAGSPALGPGIAL